MICHEGTQEVWRYSTTLSVSCLVPVSCLFYPQEKPGTHCTGGWVSPRASLDGCGKSRLQDFKPQTVQPIVSFCTGYTILAYVQWILEAFSFQGTVAGT